MKYAVICETGPEGGYSAYVPDLPRMFPIFKDALPRAARSKKFAH